MMSVAFAILATCAAVLVLGIVMFAFFLRRARRNAAGFDLPSVLAPAHSEAQRGWQQADQPGRQENTLHDTYSGHAARPSFNANDA